MADSYILSRLQHRDSHSEKLVFGKTFLFKMSVSSGDEAASGDLFDTRATKRVRAAGDAKLKEKEKGLTVLPPLLTTVQGLQFWQKVDLRADHSLSAVACLQRNRIASIQNFPVAECLTNLKLCGNVIMSISDSLFLNAPNLKILDLRANRINSLPKSLESAKCLETLLLGQNRLLEIPADLDFRSMEALLEFSAPLNFLRSVPESFWQCPVLECANFAHNRIKSIGQVSSATLNTLILSGNPLDEKMDAQHCPQLEHVET